MMLERSCCCCCDQQPGCCRRRRRREEKRSGKRGSLFTVTLLILSALLPSAIASSSTSLLRGKKKSIYRGLPQHGAQRPSIPSESDENLRRLILIASSSSSSRNHSDNEREEARRRLVNMLETSNKKEAANKQQQRRELPTNRDKLTKQQRQRIKKMNAERKKNNAERRKKKQEEMKKQQQSPLTQSSSSNKQKDKDKDKNDAQTDGKFTFGPPPQEQPKPQSSSSGLVSKYEPGNSMADAFVSALAQSFVSDGGSGGGGGDDGPSNEGGGGEIQESSAIYSYLITQGSLVSKLRDTSTQIDGFEKSSSLTWTFSETYPWKVTNDVSYEGKSSVSSGLPPSSANVVVGKSLYSNMTLTLDNDDLNDAVGKNGGGAVLSFQVKATEALSWPISAFMVTLNDKIVLSPSDVESYGSTVWKRDEWAEFSIVIDTVFSSSAKYDVKFIHVANPLQLDKLPNVPAALELYMDDVRLAPFTRKSDPIDMITDGSNGAKWEDVSGIFVATSDSIEEETGYAELTFVVYTRLGGILKYELKSSTQGPFDDIAVLFNEKPHDSQFGQSANFDYVQVEMPRGKAVVKFRHRKNPGQLDAQILEGLGAVKTDGTNRVKNIEIWARE